VSRDKMKAIEKEEEEEEEEVEGEREEAEEGIEEQGLGQDDRPQLHP